MEGRYNRRNGGREGGKEGGREEGGKHFIHCSMRLRQGIIIEIGEVLRSTICN
jgi:hypothetical protein